MDHTNQKGTLVSPPGTHNSQDNRFQIQSLSIFRANLLYVVAILRNRKWGLCYRAYFQHTSHGVHTQDLPPGLLAYIFHHNHTSKSIRRLSIIINLLKFVVLSSIRCLVPVRFSIIVTISVTITISCASAMCVCCGNQKCVVNNLLTKSELKTAVFPKNESSQSYTINYLSNNSFGKYTIRIEGSVISLNNAETPIYLNDYLLSFQCSVIFCGKGCAYLSAQV